MTWTTPGYAAAADGVYAVRTSGYGTNYLKLTDFDFGDSGGVPADATINGITVTIKRRRQGTGSVVDSVVRLVVGDVMVGDNKAKASNWPTSAEEASYGGGADTWGLTVTAAQIRASDFGVALAVTQPASGASAEVDSGTIRVQFNSSDTVEGVEGGVEIEGILKPLALGRPVNVALDLVNAQQNIWRLATGFGAGADRVHIPLAIRDRGVHLVQPNRVIGDDLETSSAWTLGTDWTIDDGKLSHAPGASATAYATLAAPAAAAAHILVFHQAVVSGSGLASVALMDGSTTIWTYSPASTEEGFITLYVAAGIDASEPADSDWRLVFTPFANAAIDIDLVAYFPVPDFATAALLEASTPTPGGFSTCIAEGLVMLGSLPAGQVTADFAHRAYSTPASFTGAEWRVGHVVERILTGVAGMTSGTDFSAADITALKARYASDGDWAAVYAPAAPDSPTIAEVLSAILGALLYWHLPDDAGVLRIGALDDALAGPATWTLDLDAEAILDFRFLVPADPGAGAPMKALTFGYAPNATLQPDASLAGDKTSANDSVGGLTVRGNYARAFRATSWPEPDPDLAVPAETTFIAEHHKDAYELAANAVLLGRATAQATRDRIVALRKVKRDMVQLTLPLDPATFADTAPGTVGALTSRRHGLDDGKTWVVLGRDADPGARRQTLTLWG